MTGGYYNDVYILRGCDVLTVFLIKLPTLLSIKKVTFYQLLRSLIAMLDTNDEDYMRLVVFNIILTALNTLHLLSVISTTNMSFWDRDHTSMMAVTFIHETLGINTTLRYQAFSKILSLAQRVWVDEIMRLCIVDL